MLHSLRNSYYARGFHCITFFVSSQYCTWIMLMFPHQKSNHKPFNNFSLFQTQKGVYREQLLGSFLHLYWLDVQLHLHFTQWDICKQLEQFVHVHFIANVVHTRNLPQKHWKKNRKQKHISQMEDSERQLLSQRAAYCDLPS